MNALSHWSQCSKPLNTVTKETSFSFVEFKVASKESSLRFVEFKFAFGGINFAFGEIKFAFGGIKFAFHGIKFAFCGIKFAFCEFKFFYRKNQVFVNACELHRTRHESSPACTNFFLHIIIGHHYHGV